MAGKLCQNSAKTRTHKWLKSWVCFEKCATRGCFGVAALRLQDRENHFSQLGFTAILKKISQPDLDE
jgi:hypothetical protein